METRPVNHLSVRAPVAFFVFNRPSLTERVFSAIAAARPSRLLVVADGPRADNPDDADLVLQTRRVLERVDWPCEVRTSYSDVNLGCKRRIASGLDWVFSQVDEAIILEDDTLPDPSFFPYCDELLARYRHQERVHMVSGFTMFEPGRFTDKSYHFSRCYHVWGWATWARAWSHYDIEMRRWPEVRRTRWLEQHLNDDSAAGMARAIFDQAYAGRITTWDFQWVLASWLAGGLSITPAVNLVRNIGFGELATNERDASHPLANRPSFSMGFPLRHPDGLTVVEEADSAEWTFVHRTHFQKARAPRGRLWRARLRDRARLWRARLRDRGRLPARNL